MLCKFFFRFSSPSSFLCNGASPFCAFFMWQLRIKLSIYKLFSPFYLNFRTDEDLRRSYLIPQNGSWRTGPPPAKLRKTPSNTRLRSRTAAGKGSALCSAAWDVGRWSMALIKGKRSESERFSKITWLRKSREVYQLATAGGTDGVDIVSALNIKSCNSVE